MLNAAFLALILSANAFAVVNGDVIADDEAIKTSLVSIHSKNGVCSGVVIGPHTVLAAAHCQDREGEIDALAQIGAGATKPCDITYPVETAFVPGAQKDLPFHVHAPDLILIRIANPLCGAKIAKLDPRPVQLGEELLSAGYGTGGRKWGQAERLKLLPIARESASSFLLPGEKDPYGDFYQSILAESSHYLFALPAKEGSSVCAGDSGGPLYREENGEAWVRGVNGSYLPNTKLGAEGCERAYVHAFAPVAPYLDWINEKIAEWN